MKWYKSQQPVLKPKKIDPNRSLNIPSFKIRTNLNQNHLEKQLLSKYEYKYPPNPDFYAKIFKKAVKKQK